MLQNIWYWKNETETFFFKTTWHAFNKKLHNLKRHHCQIESFHPKLKLSREQTLNALLQRAPASVRSSLKAERMSFVCTPPCLTMHRGNNVPRWWLFFSKVQLNLPKFPLSTLCSEVTSMWLAGCDCLLTERKAQRSVSTENNRWTSPTPVSQLQSACGNFFSFWKYHFERAAAAAAAPAADDKYGTWKSAELVHTFQVKVRYFFLRTKNPINLACHMNSCNLWIKLTHLMYPDTEPIEGAYKGEAQLELGCHWTNPLTIAFCWISIASEFGENFRKVQSFFFPTTWRLGLH